jgi:hypothetical protein
MSESSQIVPVSGPESQYNLSNLSLEHAVELYLYTMGFTEDGEEITGLIDELEIDALSAEEAIEMAEEALAHHTDVAGDVLALLKDGHDQTIWRKRLDAPNSETT